MEILTITNSITSHFFLREATKLLISFQKPLSEFVLVFTHLGRVSEEGLLQVAAFLERHLRVYAQWRTWKGECAGTLVETGRSSKGPLPWTPFLGGEGWQTVLVPSFLRSLQWRRPTHRISQP